MEKSNEHFTPEQDELQKQRMILDGELLKANKADIKDGKFVISQEHLAKLIQRERDKERLTEEEGMELALAYDLYTQLHQALGEKYMHFAVSKIPDGQAPTVEDLCFAMSFDIPRNEDEGEELYRQVSARKAELEEVLHAHD